MSRVRTRVAVIGGGIAGVSVAAELSSDHEVVVLEAERELARHSTGRSAALFVADLGPEVVRELSAASLPRFAEIAGPDVLRRRGGVFTAWSEEEAALLDGLIADSESTRPTAQLPPWVRRDGLLAAGVDPTVADIDVMALHGAYVGRVRRNGGLVVTGAEVAGLDRTPDGWDVLCRDGRRVSADLLVNAAGAWGDEVNALAGGPTDWLTACRRTALLARCSQLDPDGPVVGDVRGTWYLKPESGAVLVSPCDETPVPAGDARAEDVDVARALERVEQRTTLGLRSVSTAWAGLRTFASDRLPVVGWHPAVPGLFCLLGQGGYGIQAGPALARAAAAGLRGVEVLGALAPARLGELVTS